MRDFSVTITTALIWLDRRKESQYSINFISMVFCLYHEKADKTIMKCSEILICINLVVLIRGFFLGQDWFLGKFSIAIRVKKW